MCQDTEFFTKLPKKYSYRSPMKPMNIAILGCGIVGSGVARILLEMNHELSQRALRTIHLKKIVELNPKAATEKYNIPQDFFCGGGKNLTTAEADRYISEIISSDDIDLVIETIGGSNDYI
jgi:homoserine dehydrogenase